MNNITVISSYPRKNETHGKHTVGVASYAKNTVQAIKKSADKKMSITVLAEELEQEPDSKQLNLSIKRIWKRGSLSIFPKLMREILRNRTDAVVIELELAMFGGILTLLPFALFLVILRILKRKPVVVLHQVIQSLEEVGPHLGISNNFITRGLISLALPIFYLIVLSNSKSVIVFEKNLQDKLKKYGNIKKVAVIPHGVEQFTKIPTKQIAKKKLGLRKKDFIIVLFGFLAWYKGTDWILNALEEIKRNNKNHNVKLILAGGPNPNHINKIKYMRYLENIASKAKELEVVVTGFVPENEISTYYQAADVITLPYRTHMSSSGPLSMAFAFKKPFLISSNLRTVTDEVDMSTALKNLKLTPNSLVFSKPEDFVEKIDKLQKNRVLLNKLSDLSSEISKTRSWDNIGKMYYEKLTA